MRILYDHQIFTSQKYGGISRYFYELINKFSRTDGMDIKTPLIFSNNHYISDSEIVRHWQFFPNYEFKGKQRLMMPFNKMASIQQLKKQNFDLFHPTYYDPYFLNYIGNKPFVLTVYDMIHEKFSDLFSPNDPTTQNKRLLVEKASKIIAISESTKKDLMELFGTEESKIKVVYLGNSMLLEHTATLTINIPDKYILFVGSRFGYKNFDRFFEAISHLLQKNKNLSLVCAGGGAFKSTDLIRFESLGILDQIHQYDLDDSTLSLLYKHAEVFVFPSLYEGFGIPILESFACNCPLACSNTSSLPEIAGNGAEYFDPYNAESIRKAVQNILENNNLRAQLIQNGTERLKEFSWEKTAIETKKVYEEVLS
jgi:glycosyltransferase involved in cell wall biosynthesis